MSKKPTSSPRSRRPVRKSGKKKVSTSAFKRRTSVRHTFRDRLRAVECPIDLIDQIDGWKSVSSIRNSYGMGHHVERLTDWFSKLQVIYKIFITIGFMNAKKSQLWLEHETAR